VINTELIYIVGALMEDLSANAKKVYESLKKMGALSDEKLKTADDIMKGVSLGKAVVNASLQELLAKGYVKRIARQKSAGYFVAK
jgi:predicted transcriptional regulator